MTRTVPHRATECEGDEPGIAATAASMVEPGMVIGLGTGRAASAFVRQLAARRAAGLACTGVATSRATESLAARLGIPLTGFDRVSVLDIAFDGADEVDPAHNLIKGHGGALARERVVASAAARFVVLVGPEKLSPRLGTLRSVPVEALPFAAPQVARALAKSGAETSIREGADGGPFRTDNGNAIVNARFPGISDPAALEREIRAIPGVLDSGLFVGLADLVLVERRAPAARGGGG